MQVFSHVPMWIIIYIFWNIVTFILVFLDKRRARQQAWRIRERTLFLCALFGGAAGILMGMYRFRHKTQHWSFIIGIPLLLLLNIACCYLL